MTVAYFLIEINSQRKIVNKRFTPHESIVQARKEAFKFLKENPKYSAGIGKVSLTKKDYLEYASGKISSKTASKSFTDLSGICYVSMGVIGPIVNYKSLTGKKLEYYLNKDGTITRRN